MPLDDADWQDPGECHRCGGYGLASEWRVVSGAEVIATIPCPCKAGDQFRRNRPNARHFKGEE